MNWPIFVYLSIVEILLAAEERSWNNFNRQRRFGGTLRLWRDQNETESYADEHWFTQRLDHSSPENDRTWQQRYLVEDKYFKPSAGIAFLEIGGEGSIDEIFMTDSMSWIQYARQFGALCFQLEHRFYGASHPTSDLSTENMRYLSSQQALADSANFIKAMNQQYNLPQDVKWIAFGGSYAGSLAAWLRLKHPQLVHGAVSSSGPLLAQVDFKGYYKVVAESLASISGEECPRAIKDAFSEIQQLLQDSKGQEILNNEFNLCESLQNSIDNSRNIETFQSSLAESFAETVQHYNPTKPETISTLCNIMTNEALGSPSQRLASISNAHLKHRNQMCLYYNYRGVINYFQDASWKGNGMRQWLYQTCTEFGFFQTSSQESQVFGSDFPVEHFIQQCADIFGPEFNAAFINLAAEKTNAFYGGLDINVSNVVFVHGSIDPWHALGVTKSRNPKAPAIYVEGTSHCADMFAYSSFPQLKPVRQQIENFIGDWINQVV